MDHLANSNCILQDIHYKYTEYTWEFILKTLAILLPCFLFIVSLIKSSHSHIQNHQY